MVDHPQPGGCQPGTGFSRFLAEVAARQLAEWLADTPGTVLDISGPASPSPQVLRRQRRDAVVVRAPALLHPRAGGRTHLVAADPRSLEAFAPASVDAVVAEDAALSRCLAAEETLRDLRRVLRPGGRLLACVESLTGGLARLAEQGRWAELADSSAGDVMLVPGPDESITRCFWPEELREALTEGGWEVEWVRPRTVLGPSSVERSLAADPSVLPQLVRTELQLARDQEGQPRGNRLLVSARATG